MASAFSIKDIHAFFENKQIQKLAGSLKLPEILLHGEEDLECFKPLVPGLKYAVKSKIVDIIDKGKMTIVVIQKDMSSQGQDYQRITTRYVLRGVGGFGYQGGKVPQLALPKTPTGECE